MARPIESWDEVHWVSEKYDPESGKFKYTRVVLVDDDIIYYGQLDVPKHEIVLRELSSRLSRIADDKIFPSWSPNEASSLTLAPSSLPVDTYVKRPTMSLYSTFREHNVLHLLASCLIDEARVMEEISQHPHPNIVAYYGCKVNRGFITGIVLDRHLNNLTDHLRYGETIDKEPFMEALTSAILHLHSLGWAHNDLNPSNIMIDRAGWPVLIDFGSSRRVGERLSTSRGTKGWIDCEIKDYITSEKHHDISALAKIRVWLDSSMLGH